MKFCLLGLFAVGICVGQSVAPTTTFTLQTTLVPGFQEKVTPSGHYLYMIDDPQNLLRCAAAANNMPGGAPTVYVITCMQLHAVPTAP